MCLKRSAETLPLLDHCIRKYLLQLCEYMYKPVESALKVTIRMPPTEVMILVRTFSFLCTNRFPIVGIIT